MHSKFISTRVSIVLLIIATALTGACSYSPSSRYYTLQETEIGSEILPTSELSVLVGPIYMPRYLDRPQMVTRSKENQMTLAEYDRWIEPLDQGFKRVLTSNLSMELGSDRVHEFGASDEPGKQIDVQVTATIMRFDVTTEELATLSIQWTLSDPSVNDIYYTTRSALTTKAASTSYADQAKALSELVGKAAKEIATTVEQYQMDKEDAASANIN